MTKKKVFIIGSTGSIGTQTIDVIKDTDCADIIGISAGKNIALLRQQIKQVKPKYAVIDDENGFLLLRKEFSDMEIEILYGMNGILDVIKSSEIDFIINALVGNVGLVPTITAIKAKKDIAVANKETLVSSGELVMKLVKEHKVKFFPIDSEHSAIAQCLEGNVNNEIENIILTASGGPFREFTLDRMSAVTKEQALKHPNWSMGAKITIDSATMMNKGLEVIEAKWLFDIPVSKIKTLIHPQSIIHSMVEFTDGAILAQMGVPDMKVPIQYALTHPNRIKNNYERLNFLTHNNLTFSQPDQKRFPCLRLAYEAINAGGLLPAVMNAANETAVNLFLMDKIRYIDISIIIEKTMSAYNGDSYDKELSLENILEADKWARNFTKKIF